VRPDSRWIHPSRLQVGPDAIHDCHFSVPGAVVVRCACLIPLDSDADRRVLRMRMVFRQIWVPSVASKWRHAFERCNVDLIPVPCH